MVISIIAESKASKKLPQQVDKAAADLKPVILEAPPGTGKTFLAKLIHKYSSVKDGTFREIDCAKLPLDEGSMLSQLEIMARSEKGTLLIDNVDLLSQQEWDNLIQYLNPTEESSLNLDNQIQFSSSDSGVRFILASPNKIKIPDLEVHRIKLVPLAQRRGDIPKFAAYFVEKYCREKGRNLLGLNQAVLRRLISYDYRENLAELESIIKRAVLMTPADESVIPEQLLWSVESRKNTFRVDLLNQLPWLRKFLLSKWWPERIWFLVMAIFIPVVITGFLSPQNRSESMILNFLWAWWWTFSLLLFPFIGRLWCAICPFMITGEWLRKLSLWIWPRQLRSWPTKWLNKWGAWFMWAGFAAIYLWEKLWDLPHTAYLSASLLLVITGGAVIGSLIYERRLWCRYLCPIGGMNGMFAKLSMVELRASEQVCGTQCDVFACRQGSEVTPVEFAEALPNEGQATEGCPLYSVPCNLSDNRDCVFCMECVKGCPNRSVQLSLRFPGTDLWESHNGFAAEAALMLLLLGGVFLHYSDRILSWFNWGDLPMDSEHFLMALPIVTLLLSIPLVATYLTHQFVRMLDPQMPDYVTLVYAYLPLTLAANLTYYIPSAITEAGNILPVIARTFGYSGVGLPNLTWSLDVAEFLQGGTLLTAITFSIYPLLKISQRPFLSNLPHFLLMVGFTVVFFQLIF